MTRINDHLTAHVLPDGDVVIRDEAADTAIVIPHWQLGRAADALAFYQQQNEREARERSICAATYYDRRRGGATCSLRAGHDGNHEGAYRVVGGSEPVSWST